MSKYIISQGYNSLAGKCSSKLDTSPAPLIIKNCPAFESSTYYNPDMAIINACTLYDEPCENKYNCLLKQIVEKCNEEDYFVKRFPNQECSDAVLNSQLAHDILQLMEIEEV